MIANIDKINGLSASVPVQYKEMVTTMAQALGDDVVFMAVSMLGTGECSVWLYDQKALTLKITKKIGYLSCDASLIKHPETVSSNFIITEKTSLIRLQIDITFDMNAFISAFMELAAFFRKFPSVERFGCCYRFIQCSDQKRCIIYEDFDALGCYYRENLEAGRIFYGVNKNV